MVFTILNIVAFIFLYFFVCQLQKFHETTVKILNEAKERQMDCDKVLTEASDILKEAMVCRDQAIERHEKANGLREDTKTLLAKVEVIEQRTQDCFNKLYRT